MNNRDQALRKIYYNSDFVLLNVNAFLVIIGYAFAVYTNLGSVEFMKIVKSFFIVFSIIALFKNMQLNKSPFPSPTFLFILIFSFWVFLMSFFSENIGYSISKAMNFLIPLIYVYIAMHNLLNKFSANDLVKAFLRSFNLIYAIPILLFLLTGAGFSQTNIYGQGGKEGQFFVSNQYGWACSMFIISSVDLWLNTKFNNLYKIFLVSTVAAALYLVLISGNRAAWLAIGLALLIFILRLKNIRIDFKIIISIIPIVAIIWFYQLPESSLMIRINDTETQLEGGEARFNTAKLAISAFNDDKTLWFTGAGMFNYEKIIHGDGLGDFHNSYLEVLFGGGIILFLMFLNFMVFRPLYYYAKHYSKYYLIITPILVIPFFESNLTGGQFLFFPWFIFMLLFNIPPEFDKARLANKEKENISKFKFK